MQSFKKVIILPILGGASSGEPYRDITSAEIIHLKRLACPIAVSLKREQEFQSLLHNE